VQCEPNEVRWGLIGDLQDLLAEVCLDDVVTRRLQRLVDVDFLARHRLALDDRLFIRLGLDPIDDLLDVPVCVVLVRRDIQRAAVFLDRRLKLVDEAREIFDGVFF
jgi:hypothetical protein